MLESDKANTLLVVKLDRLTRSLLDLDTLVRRYFVEQRFHLLSVTESLDTRTAMGRFVLYILGLIAQWEREAISERTRDSMAHLKRQGVQLGAAPFGYTYVPELDAEGRKRIVEVPEAQALIRRIVALHVADTTPCAIARQLRKENVPAPRSAKWSTNGVMSVLVRQGCSIRRRPQTKRPPRVWDRQQATKMAAEYRADGLSLRGIATKLDEARLAPPRGGSWHAATVLALLDSLPTPKRPDVRARAQQLRSQGLSVRAVGRQLWDEGYRPERAVNWHNQMVADLLATP
jgi:DNA invertase Pin-like site-specific DNA recombinase